MKTFKEKAEKKSLLCVIFKEHCPPPRSNQWKCEWDRKSHSFVHLTVRSSRIYSKSAALVFMVGSVWNKRWKTAREQSELILV